MIHDTRKGSASHPVVAEEYSPFEDRSEPGCSPECKVLVDSAVTMTEQVVRDGTVRNPTEVRTLVTYLLG